MQLCTNFLPGGIQRHVLDLTDDLRAWGHHVSLVGDDGDWSRVGSDPDAHLLPLKSVAATGGGLGRRLSALPGAARSLRRLIRRDRPQLVHAHETAPALVARLATLGLGIPVLMTFHGAAPGRTAEVARIARLCADLTISPSQASLEALFAKGLPRSRGRQMGLGIRMAAEVTAGEVEDLREKLLGTGGRILVFSLSRLAPQKGIDAMIEVARQVTDRHPEVVFAVAGGGPLADDVPNMVAAAGLTSRFRLLGPITDVARHLAAADIFLLTSRWENLPISIVEAYRAALPVVATDCGGVRELVNRDFGALLPVDDIAGLVAALDDLIADPASRQAKGRAAREFSLGDRFMPGPVHRGFEALYRDVLSG